ncbi:MAG: response regulator [Bacteroidia bacterium]|nr:response regulator [Bacteroidia bacterium]
MKKILLIEDNNDMRENTAEILELAGYTVITAKNGKIGVDLAQKEIPDLIICDIMMPELDGYGVLHMLSKNSNTVAIPFVFLTAKTERSDLRKGMEMGADDYVTKPFDDLELLKAVESRLKKSEIIKSEYSKGVQGVYDFLDEIKSLNDLKKITDGKKIYKYKKKDVIYSEAGYPSGVYLVVKGKVKAFKTNDDGKELITSLYKEGDFFGYADLLEERTYNESTAVLEDAEVNIIPKEDFYSLIFKNTEVAKRFIKLLANDLIEKENQLLKLAYNSVRKRVAEALTTLQKRYTAGDDNFKMAISREDVANMAGTSTETAIRMLSDFKEEKLIEIKGSTITLLHIEKLERMKN